MQDYEDVQQHFDRHMKRAAERYAEGLQKAGLQPNETLTRAMAQRALTEAKESYIQEGITTLDHNLQVMMKQRMRSSARRRMRKRLLVRLPLVLLAGALNWYNIGVLHSVFFGPIFLEVLLFLVLFTLLGAICGF